MPSCGTCEYWEPIKHPSTGENTKVGECVWRPPVVHLVPLPVPESDPPRQELHRRAYFPLIDADRRCGQWAVNRAIGDPNGLRQQVLRQRDDFIEAERRDFEAQEGRVPPMPAPWE
jgi:hypothetical protein